MSTPHVTYFIQGQEQKRAIKAVITKEHMSAHSQEGQLERLERELDSSTDVIAKLLEIMVGHDIINLRDLSKILGEQVARID